MNRNQYHKPIISLNHIWQINERSSLSTALYVSLATGGGYSGRGRNGYSNSSPVCIKPERPELDYGRHHYPTP